MVDKNIEEFGRIWLETVWSKQHNIPQRLGHYTDGESVEGILRKGELWATNIKYVNDAEEQRHGCNMFAKAAKKRLSDPGSSDGDKEALERIRKLARGLWDGSLQGPRALRDSLDIFCLSQDCDSLSQWQAYCPPGHGYCVVFRGNEIATDGRLLVKCIYKEEHQLKVCNELLDTFLLVLRDTKMHDIWITQNMLWVSAIFKHDSFFREEEWRLIVFRKSNEVTPVRRGRYSHIPYQKISINRNHINGIVLGPNPFEELAVRGLRALDRKIFEENNGDKEYQSIKMGRSRTPFRAVKP